MPGALFLEGEKVNLRTLEEEDLEFIRDNFNHPEVRGGLSYIEPQNLEQEREWFEEVVCKGEETVLAVSREEEIKGVISLKPKENGETAEIGIWIGREFQGKGYGTEASKLLTDYGFRQLRFHKIFARAFKTNEASQRVWEKLGYEEEARLKQHAFVESEYRDIFIYGVTADEWKS